MKNEFLKYDDFELSMEETFIEWVKNGRNDAQWKGWLDEHPEKEATVTGARSLIENIQFKSFHLDKEAKADLWATIDQATGSDGSIRKTRRIFVITSIAAAAILLFLMYAIFVNPSGAIDIQTKIGSQEIVNLPDNSVIKLNAISRVQYDKGSFASNRSLKLEGEAFFNVEKGSTFTVVTDHGSVEVLGTSFNVYSRKDSLAVACYTGRVRVSKGSEEVILVAGESVALTSMTINLAKRSFEVEADDPSWTKGMFTFENQKLNVVFEELSRQYNVDITYEDPSIPDEMVGSAFFEAGSLEKALDEITYPYALEYRIEGRTVFIKK